METLRHPSTEDGTCQREDHAKHYNIRNLYIFKKEIQQLKREKDSVKKMTRKSTQSNHFYLDHQFFAFTFSV